MEAIQIVNAVANLIIAISTSLFIVFIFGRMSMMHKLPKYESIFVKISLSFLAAGSLLSFLTFTIPPITEVFLNIGLACLFIWICFFHYKYFVKK